MVDVMCADVVGELVSNATTVKHSLVVEKIIIFVFDIATYTLKLSKADKEMFFALIVFPESISIKHVTSMVDNLPKHKRKCVLASLHDSFESLSLIEDRERFLSLWLEELPKPVQKAMRAYIK